MIAAMLAGCLVVAVLAHVRIRPDHRVRDTPDHRVRNTPSVRPAPRRLRVGRRPSPCGPAELAGWCDALARDVRSGASLAAALRAETPPTRTAFVEARHRLERGVPLADALSVPATSPDEHAVLMVLSACADHGGPAAQPLDRVASTLRRRAADQAERAVHSAQARLSASVMTVLPGAVLVLLLTTSPSVRAVVPTPFGAIVIVVGLGLNVLGWWWMRRIISGGRR